MTQKKEYTGEIMENKQSDLAHNSLEEIRNLIKEQGKLFLVLGKKFKEFRDEKQYLPLGFDNWPEFLTSGQLNLDRKTIYAYINIYEIFVLKLQHTPDELADISWGNLWAILARVKKLESGDQANEWIEKARTLSRTDLRLELGDPTPQEKEENPFYTRVIKAFYHPVCKKFRPDMEHSDICHCDDKNSGSASETIEGKIVGKEENEG